MVTTVNILQEGFGTEILVSPNKPSNSTLSSLQIIFSQFAVVVISPFKGYFHIGLSCTNQSLHKSLLQACTSLFDDIHTFPFCTFSFVPFLEIYTFSLRAVNGISRGLIS